MLLILSAAVLVAPAAGQEPQFLRRELTPADPSRPIGLYADEVITWQGAGGRQFLLRGSVHVEQGETTVRLPEAVVWVDEGAKARTGAYRLDLYGEGGVEIKEGRQVGSTAGALLRLTTRGDIRIKSYARKVSEKNLERHALVLQGARWREQAGWAGASASPPPASNPPPALSQPVPPPELGFAKPNPAPSPSPASAGEEEQEEGPRTVGFQEAPPPPAPPRVEPVPAVEPPLTSPPIAVPTPPGPKVQPVPSIGAPSIGAPPPGSVGPPPLGPPLEVPSGIDDSLPLPPRDAPPRQLTIRPRSSQEIQARNYPLPSGETAVVVTSGVILSVGAAGPGQPFLDIEADRLVFWTKGESQQLLNQLRAPQGRTSNSLEFYLSGNVEIRNQGKKETQVLRADEVYYDVGRGVAVALRGDLEVKKADVAYPVHLKADELLQINPKLFQSKKAVVFASALPSDPGLTVQVADATFEQIEVPKRTLFGREVVDPRTGQPRMETQRIFTGRNMILRAEGIPIFYFPYLKGDVEDPLGPIENISFNYSQIFGFQLLTTLDVYDLFGVDPVPGTRWNLMADLLTKRGPALGTEFDYAGTELFGIPNRYQGLIKAWGIYDDGEDILGGSRGTLAFPTSTTAIPITHPLWRGRFLARHNLLDLPYGFTVQAQAAAISDQNFLEQYFANEWFNDPNQETYLYVKQQGEHWAWTALAEPRLRRWITETEWLPRVSGHILGYKIFDLATYNLHADAGYARLRPAEQLPVAFEATDAATDTGRFDLWQELSVPFNLGALNVVPYAVGDLTYYTNDLTGNERGRLYGAVGVRSHLPLSRLYPGVCSEVFNLDGIFHKISLWNNYYLAGSDTAYSRLPQLDRFNDDASDYALRSLQVRQAQINPANATFLTTSPVVDPQVYALRRLIVDRIDTRDDMQVLQFGVGQRWQTKRGLPGRQHVIDWMTLDVRASLFPAANRDNFGNSIGIVEYDWLWNIGDRTALTSSGWFEPFAQGPSVFNFGTHLGRPDGTNFYLGYRQIDPLNSQSVVGAISFPFSGKYALTASSVYDFGVDMLAHTIYLTRTGTDVQVTLGFNYNSTLSSFGVVFEIVPNLVPAGRRRSFLSGLAAGAPGGALSR